MRKAKERTKVIDLRLATLDDFDFFYDLKCEDSNIFWTGHGEKPERENLYLFYKNAVEKADEPSARKIFIVENDGVKIGHLYIIPDIENDSFELAPAISERYCGHGYAQKAIGLGLKIGGGTDLSGCTLQ